jgi:CTP synthase (UTP-ammonia lyase)
MRPLRIGIVGDFDRSRHSHWATEAALFHSAAELGLALQTRWIATTAVAADRACLQGCDGIWGAPGAPFASADGMLAAIERARVRDVPYLGTCAGFQYALIELTRNALGLADADSAENDPGGKSANIVVTPVVCPVPERVAGKPVLAGEGVARPVPGSLLERACGGADLRGEFFCSLEANERFVARWEQAGLRVAARGRDGEMRAFELPRNRFFVATLFQPQLSSSCARPHPLIGAFLRAAART